MGNVVVSPFTLGERRNRSVEMFAQGFDDEEIAEELSVSPKTIRRYRIRYERQIQDEVVHNPRLLYNYLENTIRSLHELDLVRKRAWDRYEQASSDSIRAQMLGISLRALDSRAKLFGLFGVKQEYFAHVQQVHTVQQKLFTFMQQHLCEADKRKLEEFLSNDLQEFLVQGMPTLAIEDASVVD